MSSGHYEDLSSSEDSDSTPRRSRLTRSKGQVKGPSIHDGPQAIAKFRVGAPSRPRGRDYPGYLSENATSDVKDLCVILKLVNLKIIIY